MNHNKTKKPMGARIALFALCGLLAAGLASCGKNKTTSDKGQNNAAQTGQESRPDFVYVAKFLETPDNLNSFSGTQIVGDKFYCQIYHYDNDGYTGQELTRYQITEEGLGAGETVFEVPETEKATNFDNFAVDAKENLYLILNKYPELAEGEEPAEDYWQKRTTFLRKYDAQGNLLFESDITDVMRGDENNSWIQGMMVDEEGRVCTIHSNLIRFFDAEGKQRGEASIGSSWLQSSVQGKNGKAYVSYYDNSASGGHVLAEVDLNGAKLGTVYKNLKGDRLSVVDENTLLTSDENGAKLYHLDTQDSEDILNWIDSDIDGMYVQTVNMMEDGRIFVMIRNWETNTTEMALLAKTASDQIAQKETLVVGSLYEDQSLQRWIVDFNKTSDKYRIQLKTFLDYDNWSENSYSDAVTAMNNALTSDNCPDILSLSGLDMEMLAKKGVLEDLAPYLDQSKVLSKEDYFKNILDSMTYDGKLVSIPYSFSLTTLAGKTSDVGSDMGWSTQDFIAFAKAHPDAEVLSYAVRENMLYYMLYLNKDTYMDKKSGECHFDTPEFKEILEFVKTFPGREGYEYNNSPEPTRIAAGKLLLLEAYISDFREIQVLRAEFMNEPITFIGYPNDEGNSGCLMQAANTYAISSKAKNKEAAWEFLESVLASSPDQDRFYYGFSARKSGFQEQKEKATKIQYVTNPETGEVLLDENGEPVVEGGGGSIGFAGDDGEEWTYEYHIPTEEEVSVVEMLLEKATLKDLTMDEQILNIIQEETAPFFDGKKNVDEVTNIIQSRISLYMKENL